MTEPCSPCPDRPSEDQLNAWSNFCDALTRVTRRHLSQIESEIASIYAADPRFTRAFGPRPDGACVTITNEPQWPFTASALDVVRQLGYPFLPMLWFTHFECDDPLDHTYVKYLLTNVDLPHDDEYDTLRYGALQQITSEADQYFYLAEQLIRRGVTVPPCDVDLWNCILSACARCMSDRLIDIILEVNPPPLIKKYYWSIEDVVPVDEYGMHFYIHLCMDRFGFPLDASIWRMFNYIFDYSNARGDKLTVMRRLALFLIESGCPPPNFRHQLLHPIMMNEVRRRLPLDREENARLIDYFSGGMLSLDDVVNNVVDEVDPRNKVSDDVFDY